MCALSDDTEQRLYNHYVADCAGMIVRKLYETNEFKLYSEIVQRNEKQDETKEQVLDKILLKLGG